MKLKDILRGTPYAYCEKYGTPRMVYRVGEGLYRETRGYVHIRQERRLFEPHNRGDASKSYLAKSGVLFLEIRHPDKLTDAEREFIATVSAESLIATNSLYPLSKLGFADEGSARLCVYQNRMIENTWAAEAKARAEADEWDRRQREERRREREVNYGRMKAVVEVIERLNEGKSTYHVFDCDQNRAMEIRLEDLEMLVGIARTVLPGVLGEQKD